MVADVTTGTSRLDPGPTKASPRRYSASYLFDAVTGEHAPGLAAPSADWSQRQPSCRLWAGHLRQPAAGGSRWRRRSRDRRPVMLGRCPSCLSPIRSSARLHRDDVERGPQRRRCCADDHHPASVTSTATVSGSDSGRGGDGGELAMTQHFDFQHAVVAWSGLSGEVLNGWPRQIEDINWWRPPW